MRNKLLELERLSAALDPNGEERKNLRDQVVEHTEEFIEDIYKTKAYHTHKSAPRIKATELGKELQDIEDIVKYLSAELDEDGINPASGGHLGYIPGGGIYASSLADYWAAISNRYAGVYFANPGAVRIENKLIRWVSNLIGYPATAHGNLTSGGSIANLIGIVSARHGMQIKSRDIENSVIYVSKQSHASISKSIQVAGLAEAHIRFVAMDDQYRMDPNLLEKQVIEDKKKGLNPFLIAASAGTTDLGAVDPMASLAKICKEHNLWLHVDAAYGGFFILTDEGRTKFRGIELSDSLAIDPHKGMFLPYGLGICIVRDKKIMLEAFTFDASYLQDIKVANEEINPMDVSPEMTKHFRGLRMWLPLALYGIEPFKNALDEKLLLAKYFYSEVQKIPGFVVGPAPQLSVVTFRYVPEDASKSDEFNKRILDEVHKDGRVFFSSTSLEGKFTLRLAILSFRTHLKTIDLTLLVLNEKIELINQESVSKPSIS